MSDLKTLLRQVEDMPTSAILKGIMDHTKPVLEGLESVGIDEPVKMYLTLVISMIAVDGKLAENEYQVLSPMVEAVIGRKMTYAEAKDFVFKGSSFNDKELRANITNVVNMVYNRDQRVFMEIMILLIYISGVDGDICRRERKFLEQLMR